MACRLAVAAPRLGARSETFIRRHMQDLLPGSTAVIVATAPQGPGRAWSVDGPCLVLDRLRMPPDMTMAERMDIMLGAVRRFVAAHNVEVLLCEFLDFATSFVRLTEESHIQVFAHGHGYDVSRTLTDASWRARYLCLNQSHGLVVVSHAAKAALTRIGLDASSIHVIPCGVHPLEPPTGRRHGGTAISCLAVGRMVSKKAPILTLDAFRRAARIVPELTLDYVGEGPLLAAAHQFVQAFQLEGRVRLHGGTPHDAVLHLMQGTDLFLQHSITDPLSGDMEGLPVAILEAMAHRLPVVSTVHAGIPEAVEHAVTGFLVPEGDSRAMAEYIVRLARDPALRQRLGEAGCARVRRQFTWEAERTALLRTLGFTDAGGSR
jgi:colanic acid/amylovoran biosynthesis glycosyltransferase